MSNKQKKKMINCSNIKLVLEKQAHNFYKQKNNLMVQLVKLQNIKKIFKINKKASNKWKKIMNKQNQKDLN